MTLIMNNGFKIIIIIADIIPGHVIVSHFLYDNNTTNQWRKSDNDFKQADANLY